MQSSDPIMTAMFLSFLLLFVVIGLYPAWRRTARKIRKFLKDREKAESSLVTQFKNEPPMVSAESEPSSALNDYEIMVLKRLAQSDKGLTRKQLDAALFLEAEIGRKTLESLLHRGLIKVVVDFMLRRRFSLSEQGLSYALEHEFIPRIQRGTGRF